MTEKLVRDNIPAMLKAKGLKASVRLANQQEVVELLKKKLVEEAQEAKVSFSKKRLREELADMLEVMQALAVRVNLDWSQVLEKQVKKREKRGGIEKGYVLKMTND